MWLLNRLEQIPWSYSSVCWINTVPLHLWELASRSPRNVLIPYTNTSGARSLDLVFSPLARRPEGFCTVLVTAWEKRMSNLWGERPLLVHKISKIHAEGSACDSEKNVPFSIQNRLLLMNSQQKEFLFLLFLNWETHNFCVFNRSTSMYANWILLCIVKQNTSGFTNGRQVFFFFSG